MGFETSLVLTSIFILIIVAISLVIFLFMTERTYEKETDVNWHYVHNRHYGPNNEKRIVNRLRRHKDNENCHLICKFCENRGYEDCSDLYGCECPRSEKQDVTEYEKLMKHREGQNIPFNVETP
tara:strand:+ start:5872 stop:6243 length:372 start_codon:yes stop_codon:yes gene_type:complete